MKNSKANLHRRTTRTHSISSRRRLTATNQYEVMEDTQKDITIQSPTKIPYTLSIKTAGSPNAVDAAISGPKPFVEERDSPLGFLYTPHTVTGLLIAISITVYHAWKTYDTTKNEFSLTSGLTVMAVIFLVYCIIQLRDGLLLRPHPAFWRLVHGCAILYLLMLVFLLTQPQGAARQILHLFDSNIDPLAPPASNDRLYANDCRVYTPENPNGAFSNIFGAFDRFAVAHFVGWWGKALMFRNWRLIWVLCIMWEILEYSFQHVLANFHECWWDHWLLDVAICNLGGAALGMLTCRYFEITHFDWHGDIPSTHVSNQPPQNMDISKDTIESHNTTDVLNHQDENNRLSISSIPDDTSTLNANFSRYSPISLTPLSPTHSLAKAEAIVRKKIRKLEAFAVRKAQERRENHLRELREHDHDAGWVAKRLIEQLTTPYVWTNYQWDVFSSFQRFWTVVIVLIAAEIVELNAFFLKYVLWISPESPLNSYRLALWFLLGAAGLREWYQYIVDPTTKRLGANLWLAFAIICGEVGLILKHGTTLLQASHTPPEVSIGWTVSLMIAISWALLRFYGTKWISESHRRAILNILLVAGSLPLVWIAISQDVYSGAQFPKPWPINILTSSTPS